MLADVAARPNTVAKVSGLQVPGTPFTVQAVRPAWDAALELFGPDRLMWGSDWPVVTLASNYRRWHDTAATLLPADTHDAVFGGTAARFYGLDPSHPAGGS